MKTATFPNEWKISTVVPIPKINNTKNACDFRGINMLENDAKICEIAVKNQLVSYIESNNILSPHQSAFRKGHSCESAINLVLFKWKINIEKNKITLAVFLDFKRAFETVDKSIMIEKLKTIGINETELLWFKNYLKNRQQYTKYNGHSSDNINVNIGVPQGTALSVILFIIYINDIVKVPNFGTVFLFADDSVLVVESDNIHDAIIKMNEDLNRIYEWLCENKLMLNTNKTKWMTIVRDKRTINGTHELRIGGQTIEKVLKIKYLG